ncbi:N-acetylmuramoyl-L-alanine amidase [uncultured Butyricimonas sp.]|uniref:N-acetylmuramoyl-L-alanine amidase n=1 Tax=uncultured Butyricimonas sp. TaxID=1268785 RepID=UPI0026DAA242|nr:N-acetylmuramoyl-L-alanine amidase [uncultured Butyricimonas sp.]
MDSFSIFNSQFSIVNHRLMVYGAVHLTCSKNTRPLVKPDTIVLHYTAGKSALSSAFYLCRPDVGASAHVVIGRDGKIVQLVPFNIEAWHAGRSYYRGRAEFNHFSIGIELDNLGKLSRDGKRFVAECGAEVMPSDVYADDSGEKISYWHKYTDKQVHVLNEVCRSLVLEYPIYHILRHSDITPRKIDPGPALPDITLEDLLLGRSE